MLNKREYNEIRFFEYIPEVENIKTMPLIVYLHGAGERGTDIEKLNTHGPIKEMLAGKVKSNFIVIAPQCEEIKTWWDYAEILYKWISEYIKQPFVDKKRVYLTGNSMGGYGTWSLAMAHPELFAAIVPICGGGFSWNAAMLKNTPVWAFHCVNDGVVPCWATIDMVEHVKQYAESEVKLTIYPENSHDAWTSTYQNQEVYDWLLKLKKE
jgi:predicted peptidase